MIEVITWGAMEVLWIMLLSLSSKMEALIPKMITPIVLAIKPVIQTGYASHLPFDPFERRKEAFSRVQAISLTRLRK